MTSLILRGGTVVDSTGARRADVALRDGHVQSVGARLDAPRGAHEIDCGGCLVAPGLVDLHVHLRQPGGEEAETVETGSRAAAVGGFTAVVAMPNTNPAADSVEVVRAVRAWGEQAGLCDVHPAAAITVGRAGAALSDLEALYDAGVRIFTDDGNEVADAALMRAAFERAVQLPGAVLGQHSECAALVEGGHLHEGAVSASLGLAGRPAEAEEITVARDLALARLTGGRLHVLHASVSATVEMVRRARAEGVRVSMEVTPQHLWLTDELCRDGDPTFKVNPPLRTGSDVAAMRAGLAAGVIDAIATDHAPHAPHTKARPFAEAPPGMVGLETAVGMVWTELVHPGVLSASQALAALSWNPAAIAGLSSAEPGAGHGGPIVPGAAAHVCVIDPEASWTVRGGDLVGRAHNTPFEGRTLRGRVRHTFLAGEPTVLDGVAQR
ncbi:MAG: dihydroorotase [Acidimicrobiia bacterium]|nr:dihydroorotase [Acidimicrobiia bacterium]